MAFILLATAAAVAAPEVPIETFLKLCNKSG